MGAVDITHSKRRRTTVRRLIWGILLLPVLAFAADSPFDGTWKIDINTTQSPDKPSANAPTFTFKSTPDGLMYSDSSSGESFDVKFDGKEYPVKGPRGGTVSVVKLNERSIVQT